MGAVLPTLKIRGTYRVAMGATTTTTTTTTVAKSAFADGAKQSGKILLNEHSFDVVADDLDNNNVSDNNHNNQRNGGNVVGGTNGGVDKITAANGADANASNADPAAAADNDTSADDDNVEEFVYFGFKVGAKLKWTNIIGIIVIHMMFVYTFMHNPFLPRIYTYAWGKPTD